MPTLAETKAALTKLADRHGSDLESVCERGIAAANALYRHLPSTSKTDGVYAQLKRSLTAIVETARTDARNLAGAHTLDELRSMVGSKADGLTIPMGSDPMTAEVAGYIDNAVDATHEAVSKVGESERAEAFEGTAYRAHTIIDSEVTNQYRRARDTANAYLRSLPDAQAAKYGFKVARDKQDFREAAAETRDGSKWLPIIGERWNAVASACDKCRAADGEMRPIGFAFTLPGPSAHARCRCIRTLWCLAIPMGEDRADGHDERSAPRDDRGNDRSNPSGAGSTEEHAMGDATRDGPDSGGLRYAYAPEEVRSATTVDVENRTIEFVATSDAVDSYDTKFVAAGVDLKRFKKNPVFLSCHNSRDTKMICGKAIDMRVDGKKLIIKVRFTPEGMQEEADRVFNLYATDFLRGCSIGFNPLEWEDEEQEGKGRNGRVRFLRTFTKWELVELSAVPVPSNPDALARDNNAAATGAADTIQSPHSAATRQGKGSQAMTDKDNEMVQGELLINALPPELAAVLSVATVDEAKAEISKRAVAFDEVSTRLDAAEKSAKDAADKFAADLAAANKRAEDAEKALQKRNDDDAEAYVNALEWKTKEGKEGALVLAKANLAAFRASHPLPVANAAPMAHLLTQVLPTEKREPAASAIESTATGVTGNPITAEAERLMKAATDKGETLSRADAFAQAFEAVSKQSKQNKPAARDRI